MLKFIGNSVKVFRRFYKDKDFLKKWGGRAFFGISDQAVFSGANFLVNFLLARWLTESDYGAFSIAFSAFLFFAGIPSSVIWEPMAVFGAHRDESLGRYLGRQLQYQIIFTSISAVVLALASAFLEAEIRQTFILASLSMPFILLVWFFRQACYIQAQTRLAFFVSLTYTVLYVGSLIVLRSAGVLYSGIIYLGMAFAGLGASMVGSRVLRISWTQRRAADENILADNWRYGKFILLASFASGISSFLYLPLLGIWLGLAEAGAYRAMQNLILPLQQMMIAVALILLPQLSKVVDAQGEKPARRIVSILLLLTTLFVVGYGIVLWFLGAPVVDWLYQKPYYQSFTWLLPVMSATFVVTAAAQLLGLAVRAFKRPQAVLWAKFAGAALVLTLGIYATYEWQLNGVLLATFVSTLAELLVLLWIYIRKQNA